MLRAGAVLLTLWAGVHLVIALGIVIMVLGLGQNAPALMILYGDIQGKGVDTRALATIDALAALGNGWRAAMCALSLTIIWTGLLRRAAWAFWSLAVCVCFVQAVDFASGSFYQHRSLLDAVPSLLPLAGIIFAAIGVFRFQKSVES